MRRAPAPEITAAATIAAADGFGLPVSTTHVLSSGIAGTMAANGSGLQFATVRNIAMAWVLISARRHPALGQPLLAVLALGCSNETVTARRLIQSGGAPTRWESGR